MSAMFTTVTDEDAAAYPTFVPSRRAKMSKPELLIAYGRAVLTYDHCLRRAWMADQPDETSVPCCTCWQELAKRWDREKRSLLAELKLRGVRV